MQQIVSFVALGKLVIHPTKNASTLDRSIRISPKHRKIDGYAQLPCKRILSFRDFERLQEQCLGFRLAARSTR